MRVISHEFNEKERKAYLSFANEKKVLKTFVKAIAATMAAAVVAATGASNALAFDLNGVINNMTKIVNPGRLGGGTLGAAWGSKKDSDLERGAKVAAGVAGGELISKTLQGKPVDVGGTLFDSAAGFIGGTLRSKHDSDSVAMAKAAGVIAGANILKEAYRINAGMSQNQSVQNGLRRGQGKCHLETIRVIENGQVKERVVESCSVDTDINHYGDLDNVMVTSKRSRSR